MEKIVLIAEVRNEKLFTKGYIVIDGNKKEGIFGKDYVQIESENQCLNFLYHELKYDLSGDKPVFFYNTTKYSNDSLYTHELYCPEQYMFLDNKKGMSLTLVRREKNRLKIAEIITELNKTRQEVFQ